MTHAMTAARKPEQTRTAILEAAKGILRERGYSGFATRDVAAAAEVPLSQIHYHFGSKRGLVLDLFAYQNSQLVERQEQLFSETALPLARRWEIACDYLDEDIRSGYVRTLMELMAAGWSDPDIAGLVRESLGQWVTLLNRLACEAERRFGPLGPFSAEDVAILVSTAFIGAEAFIMLDFESETVPVRRALRQVGQMIARLEEAARTEG